MNRLIFLLVIATSSHSVVAGELSYTCIVTHIYDLADNGALKKSAYEMQQKNKTFSVSRVTGEIIGSSIPTLLANSTKVINIGSKDYSFKTISYFDAVNKPFSAGDETKEYTANAQLLEIQEFIKAKNKPFVAMSMSGSGIVTGLCK
ncbi:MAG: hypothetical protein OEZ39_05475 [Gammaproteobacteria bacterium]|nr:hypothetical protein [Gammaproteobacteria bacterium]MDH5651305.1 hypothetical protein [Gammaproteobacteria bacterium]